MSYDPDLYRLLVTYPQEIIPIFDVVVNQYYAENCLGEGEDAFNSIQAQPRNPRWPCLPPAERLQRGGQE